MKRDPSNFERSCRAEKTLILYAAFEDRMDELSVRSQAATLLSDMLADLMHYAQQTGIDFRNCIDVAEMHFEAEIAEVP